MTIKWLYHLNKHHVPARAMGVDMVVNVLLILFIANNLAILYMSNIGYVFAHVLALSGFLLLRRDRPRWPRPIKVGSIWVGIAWILCLANLVFLIWGISQRNLAATLGGYPPTATPFLIGIAILVGSVLLFFYRRAIQDKAKITFKDLDVPVYPTDEQMRLLHEEEIPG
jgi:amino acid transporter